MKMYVLIEGSRAQIEEHLHQIRGVDNVAEANMVSAICQAIVLIDAPDLNAAERALLRIKQIPGVRSASSSTVLS